MRWGGNAEESEPGVTPRTRSQVGSDHRDVNHVEMLEQERHEQQQPDGPEVPDDTQHESAD